MAKHFDPLEYNYELVSDNGETLHFQRKLNRKKVSVHDIIEISHWKKPGIWIIYVESLNLNQFLPDNCQVTDSIKITLFIGEFKGDFDYQLLIRRFCTDPEILIQLGA